MKQYHQKIMVKCNVQSRIISWVLGFNIFQKTHVHKKIKAQKRASEHKGRKSITQGLVLITRASTGVVSTLYYCLSSLSFNSSNFVTTPLFASAPARVRCRHY